MHTKEMLREVRSSLELTDACIIDSDNSFVTFAVKIPRTVIKANHHFLLAASEAATDCRPSPAPAPESQIKVVSHWATRALSRLPFLLGGCASTCVLAVAAVWAYYWIIPSADYKTVVPDKTTIASGDPLVLIVEARHNRVCHPTFDRTIVREDTGEIVSYDRVPGKHVTPDAGYNTFEYPIPMQTTLPAGKYALNLVGDFDCGFLDDHTRHIGTVHFTVTK